MTYQLQIGKMGNLYYKVAMDLVVSSSKNPAHKHNWKLMTMVYMTMLTSLNIGTILIWFGNLTGINVVWVRIELLPGTM